MNKERVLKLANAIEKNKRTQFKQSSNCGCVAAWALKMFDPKKWQERQRCFMKGGNELDLIDILEVKPTVASAIYVPEGWCDSDLPAGVQRERAGAMLRKLASTGKVSKKWFTREVA